MDEEFSRRMRVQNDFKNYMLGDFDFKGTREVKIRRCMNGFLVMVGCVYLVFEDQGRMLKELSRYLDDSGAVEKEYMERHTSARY